MIDYVDLLVDVILEDRVYSSIPFCQVAHLSRDFFVGKAVEDSEAISLFFGPN